jgi:hypothetical protein
MSRKTRTLLGLLILAISISLLIWGFLPSRRESRTLPISPSDLQLPAPSSLHMDALPLFNASLIQPVTVS